MKYAWLLYPLMILVAVLDIVDLARAMEAASMIHRVTLLGLILLLLAAWHQFELRRNLDPRSYAWMIALLVVAGLVH